MASDASFTWLCPFCERRVPAREGVCHCGTARPRAPAKASLAAASSPARRRSRLAALSMLLGCCLLAVAVFRSDAPPSAQAPASTRPPRRAQYPPLPRAPREENLSPPPATPSPEASPVESPEPSPSASPEPTPTPLTGMDQRREDARRLLETPLRSLSSEADRLDRAFAKFREACRPEYTPARAGSLERDWYAIWQAGSDLAWPSGAPLDAETPTDCGPRWSNLLASAGRIEDALNRLEDDARAKNVLPGHLRELLASCRLGSLKEHSRRGR